MSAHALRIARGHCLAPERVEAPIYGGRYSKLFPDLGTDLLDASGLPTAAGKAGWWSTADGRS